MRFAYIFALCLSMAGVYAADDDDEPCCYPVEMSGEVQKHGKKLYDFYMDYEGMKMVEDWHGNRGTDKVVYDLHTLTRYRLKSDGECSDTKIQIAEFDQCIPLEAAYEAHDDVDGHKMATYKYKVGALSVKKTVQKDTCLPSMIHTAKGNGALTLSYVNMVAKIDDRSFLDVDMTNCEL